MSDSDESFQDLVDLDTAKDLGNMSDSSDTFAGESPMSEDMFSSDSECGGTQTSGHIWGDWQSMGQTEAASTFQAATSLPCVEEMPHSDDDPVEFDPNCPAHDTEFRGALSGTAEEISDILKTGPRGEKRRRAQSICTVTSLVDQAPIALLQHALPPLLVRQLLLDANFAPGTRPKRLNYEAGSRPTSLLFKEYSKDTEIVGKRGKGSHSSDKVLSDRWHNSGGSSGARDMTDGAKGTPIVRRRYGAVKQVRSGERKSGEIKGCYRYHAYTLLECTTASDGQVVVEELREVTLFHVMPKRVERGRPSKEESQQPEDMWSKYNPAWCTNARKELNEHNVNAHGGIKTEQNAQNVTPTNATPPRSIGRSTSGATFEPPRSQSAYVTLTDEGAVVKSGAAPLVVRAPPVEIETEHGQGPGCLVQFTSENSGENLVIGAITTSMDGRGVALHSAAGDIAEWHPLRESTASSTLQAGEIVGIHAAGRICRATAAANQCGIISRRPMLVGSMPADPAAAGGVVAYTGQVPIRVRGAVKAGDPLVPTGDGDGVAVALSTFALEHPAATRFLHVFVYTFQR